MNPTTYSASAKGIVISHDRAMRELAKHGAMADVATFYADCGKRETYKASAVLAWLGY